MAPLLLFAFAIWLGFVWLVVNSRRMVHRPAWVPLLDTTALVASFIVLLVLLALAPTPTPVSPEQLAQAPVATPTSTPQPRTPLPAPTRTSAATEEAQATPVPTATQAATPSPSPTSSPTPTSTPTPTETPAPTPTPSPIPTATPTVTASPTPIVYVVQQGDTLSRIAQRFGVSVDELRLANRLTSDILRVGQELVIPREGESITRTYIVQPGDTLYLIAERFGVSVDDIVQLNPTINPNSLQVGQELLIP